MPKKLGAIEVWSLKDFIDKMNNEVLILPGVELQSLAVTRDGSTYSYHQTFTWDSE